MMKLKDSYRRALSTGHLVDCHYRIFLECDPRIAPFFSGTDLERHKKMLRSMHTMLLMFVRGDEFAEWTVKRVAKEHGPSGLNVPEELYEYWLTSLIEALRECDPAFGPELEKAWREVGRKAIAFFVAAAR